MRRKAHRRRHRKNFYGAGMVNRKRSHRRRHRMNPFRRRRHYRHNVGMARWQRRRYQKHHAKRHHYRRNPESHGIRLAGVSLPPIDAVLATGAGLFVPGMITSYVLPMVPASFQGPYTGLLVKGVVGVVIPGMLLRRFVNSRVGNYYMIGGLASLTIDLVKQFAPGLIPGLGQWQPMLGGYFSYPQAPGRIVGLPRKTVAAQLPPMISEAPDRLNPASRF